MVKQKEIWYDCFKAVAPDGGEDWEVSNQDMSQNQSSYWFRWLVPTDDLHKHVVY